MRYLVLVLALSGCLDYSAHSSADGSTNVDASESDASESDASESDASEFDASPPADLAPPVDLASPDAVVRVGLATSDYGTLVVSTKSVTAGPIGGVQDGDLVILGVWYQSTADLATPPVGFVSAGPSLTNGTTRAEWFTATSPGVGPYTVQFNSGTGAGLVAVAYRNVNSFIPSTRTVHSPDDWPLPVAEVGIHDLDAVVAMYDAANMVTWTSSAPFSVAGSGAASVVFEDGTPSSGSTSGTSLAEPTSMPFVPFVYANIFELQH